MPLNEDQAKYLAWAIGAVRMLREMKTYFKGINDPMTFIAFMTGSTGHEAPQIAIRADQGAFLFRKTSIDFSVTQKSMNAEMQDVLKHVFLGTIDSVGEHLREQVAKLGGDPGKPFQEHKPGLVMTGETIKKEI